MIFAPEALSSFFLRVVCEHPPLAASCYPSMSNILFSPRDNAMCGLYSFRPDRNRHLKMKKSTLLLLALAWHALMPQVSGQSQPSSVPTGTVRMNFVRMAPESAPSLADWLASDAYKTHWGHLEWQAFRQFTDGQGMLHTRMQALHEGRPIEGAVLVLHTRTGRLHGVNGKIPLLSDLEGRQVHSESAARQTAIAAIGARTYMWELPGADALLRRHAGDPKATFSPTGTLCYVAPAGQFQYHQRRLAWKFDLYAAAPHSRDEVYVDAETGKVLWRHNRLQHADAVGTAHTGFSGVRTITTDEVAPGQYRLHESGRGGGITTLNLQTSTYFGDAVDFVDADNVWDNVNAAKDQYATDVHLGAEAFYDYLLQRFQWNSLDNNALPIRAYFHFDVDMSNAFWDGHVVAFGDGYRSGQGWYHSPLVSPEVVAHELTHGLIQHSADLIYDGEPGSINESIADMFGQVIEAELHPGTWNWVIGESFTAGGWGIRDMRDPNRFFQSDTYGGDYYDSTANVHYLSSIGNKWFQVLVDGETGVNDFGSTYQVDGIGMQDAAAIVFHCLTTYLTPLSDFRDFRALSIESARQLFGGCAPQHIQVAKAWDAVGVDGPLDPQPKADFEALRPTASRAPAAIQFLNRSHFSESYLWDFGDGGTSTLLNPVHTYQQYGTYTVTLTVTGCGGGQDVLVRQQYIRVDSSILDVHLMPTRGRDTITACEGVLLDPGGDGLYGINLSGSVLIQSPGAQTITLDVKQFALYYSADYLDIHDGPDANAPLIGRYTWNMLPNGRRIHTSGPAVFLKFTTNHQDQRQGFEIEWHCRTATDPPIAEFTAQETLSCTGFVRFSHVGDIGVDTWQWDFGDGNTSTSRSPVHRYAADGTYTVRLITCNAYGCDTLARPQYIRVNQGGPCMHVMPTDHQSAQSLACTGILVAGEGVGQPPQQTHGIFTIAPPGADRIWLDFSNFTLTPGLANLYIYQGTRSEEALVGRYTANELWGRRIYIPSNVAILELDMNTEYGYPVFEMQWYAENAADGPNAAFTAPEAALLGDSVPFVYAGLEAVTYHWDFGDGDSSTLAQPRHRYAEPGRYTVTLRVVSGLGCSATSTREVRIADPDAIGVSLRLYPNPSLGQMTLEASPPPHSAVRLEVANATGQVVYAEGLRAGVILRRQLDLQGLPAGMYFLRLSAAGWTEVKKFVITRE
jgi:Zn-dependent metalloprotease/chitodextrinase